MRNLVALLMLISAFKLSAEAGILINEVSRSDVVWIELHNTSSSAVDLTGWRIRNSSGEDPLSGTIKPGGYLVICESRARLEARYHDIKAPIFEVRDGTIGSGLKSNSDMVALIDRNGRIVDELNWGMPSSSWRFFNNSLWQPGILDQAPVLARIPNAYDRDLPEDFRGVATGTPGEMNQVYNGLGTVSWGKIKAIFAGQKRR